MVPFESFCYPFIPKSKPINDISVGHLPDEFLDPDVSVDVFDVFLVILYVYEEMVGWVHGDRERERVLS